MNNEQIEERLSQVKARRARTERVVAIAGCSTIAIFWGCIALWVVDTGLKQGFMPGSFVLVIGTLLIAQASKHLDQFIERRLVKPYFIEDCGDVRKLHGSLRMIFADQAYKDLLQPGFAIAKGDDTHERYGCTLVAVKATPEQLRAKTEVERLGIAVTTINN